MNLSTHTALAIQSPNSTLASEQIAQDSQNKASEAIAQHAFSGAEDGVAWLQRNFILYTDYDVMFISFSSVHHLSEPLLHALPAFLYGPVYCRYRRIHILVHLFPDNALFLVRQSRQCINSYGCPPQLTTGC